MEMKKGDEKKVISEAKTIGFKQAAWLSLVIDPVARRKLAHEHLFYLYFEDPKWSNWCTSLIMVDLQIIPPQFFFQNAALMA